MLADGLSARLSLQIHKFIWELWLRTYDFGTA
jgi:hypothetical protein